MTPPIRRKIPRQIPNRPFPRPVKQRYPKRMTIAAGFRVVDGILLCADSMYTGGTKVHQPKLFGYRIGRSGYQIAIGFALAGNEYYGKMAIEDCLEGLSAPPPNQPLSMRAIKHVLRAAIKGINDSYVDTRPDQQEKDNAKFELIIGVWRATTFQGEMLLFKSSGPALLSADDYHCTGMGAYLGDYLMRNIFSRTMRIKDAALLAIQSLSAAKSYDATCGGDTQFLSISQDGNVSSVTPYDVHSSETYIAEYEQMARHLLFDIGNDEITDQEFAVRLQTFNEHCQSLRTSWSGKWLYDAGFTPRLGDLLDPESPKDDLSVPQPSQESPGGSGES